MRYALIVFVMLFAACGLDTIEHTVIDSGVDADLGSGSDAMAGLEPSPQDGHLELVVVAASLIVVLAPASAGAARRRRRDLKNEVEAKPHFS